MFSLSPIVSVFTFWFPLLLSAKALRRPSQNVQFLLIYWVAYNCVSNVQYHLQGSKVPFAGPLSLLCDLFDMWMFYSHGCLVIAYYYVPGLIGTRPGYSLVESIDHKFLDPFVSMFVVKNTVFQNAINLFSVSVSPLDDLMAFNCELCRHYKQQPKHLSFLSFGLEYFCYMDSPNELRARYLKSRRFLWSLSSALHSTQRRPTGSRASGRSPPAANDYLRPSDSPRVAKIKSNKTGSPRQRAPVPTEADTSTDSLDTYLESASFRDAVSSPPSNYNSQTNTPKKAAAPPLLRPKRGDVDESTKPRAVSTDAQLGARKNRRAPSHGSIDLPYPVRSDSVF